VFKDVYTIPLGIDFRNYIGDQVSQCDVMLVIIGQNWLTITDQAGHRRLDDAADFTRIEIEQALQRSIPVIPVLVDGIGMPRANDLPTSLEQLAFRNAATLRDPEFPSDMERIARDISKTLEEAASHNVASEITPSEAEATTPRPQPKSRRQANSQPRVPQSRRAQHGLDGL
jgi:hypothetical protein